MTVHKCAETIQGRKLFKGGNYMRKYGMYKIFFQNGEKALKKEFGNGKVSFLRLDITFPRRSDEYCLLKCVSTFLEGFNLVVNSTEVKAENDWNTRLFKNPRLVCPKE